MRKPVLGQHGRLWPGRPLFEGMLMRMYVQWYIKRADQILFLVLHNQDKKHFYVFIILKWLQRSAHKAYTKKQDLSKT